MTDKLLPKIIVVLLAMFLGCTNHDKNVDSGILLTDLENDFFSDHSAGIENHEALEFVAPDSLTSTEENLPNHDVVSLCPFDPNIPFEMLGEILQFESQDKTTCVWLRRKDLSQPGIIYKAIPFRLEKFIVGHDGSLVTIDDLAKLSWQSTHHNWYDVGQAESDTTLYRLNVGYQTSTMASYLNYTLTALDLKTNQNLWGPIELFPFEP